MACSPEWNSHWRCYATVFLILSLSSSWFWRRMCFFIMITFFFNFFLPYMGMRVDGAWPFPVSIVGSTWNVWKLDKWFLKRSCLTISEFYTCIQHTGRFKDNPPKRNFDCNLKILLLQSYTVSFRHCRYFCLCVCVHCSKDCSFHNLSLPEYRDLPCSCLHWISKEMMGQGVFQLHVATPSYATCHYKRQAQWGSSFPACA